MGIKDRQSSLENQRQAFLSQELNINMTLIEIEDRYVSHRN